MASQELKTRVIHICSDVEDFYESYNIELIEDEQELKDYISGIGDLKRNFRRIYSELKIAEGDNFARNFPHFEKDLHELTDSFKTASQKLSDLRYNGKLLETQKLENDTSQQFDVEQERLNQAKLEDEKRIEDLMTCAKSLYVEIEVRYKSLSNKCKVNIDELDAYEILDLMKREHNLHTELR